MNNTKWDELRLAMYSLGDQSPRWRTRDIKNGHICPWDREWFYHFRAGGYKTIDWVEIEVKSNEQRVLVLKRLREVHVPGEVSEHGFIVFGYAPTDRPLEYL